MCVVARGTEMVMPSSSAHMLSTSVVECRTIASIGDQDHACLVETNLLTDRLYVNNSG